MEPSKYQAAILEWLRTSSGHGCCNAVAGAGKSSTLRMAAKQLKESGVSPHDIKVIVFGKANSQDLIAKFGTVWKDSVKTLHSAGFSLLQQEVGRFKQHERVKSSKYRWIAQDMGFVPSKGRTGELTESKAIDKPDALYKMVDLVRLTLNEPTKNVIADLAAHYNLEGINKPADVAFAVGQILRVGEQQAIAHTIDYTDQVWLPVKWQLHSKPWFKPYRFVLVDECQDLNAAQLELAIALAGSKGRLLFVGDPKQAIMGFAGADNRSYQKIVERTKATELPLSICYRCPRSHIDLVRHQFPDIPIEPRDNAPTGTITTIAEAELDEHLKVGDMILCRKTAPLVTRCIKLISKGIKATVKGRDIGEQIKQDLEDIGRMPGFSYSEFPDFIRQYKLLKVQRYIGLDNEEQLTEQLNDKLEALTAIYKARVEATTIAQLSGYIDSLFSDESSPITLSTCHRAKGLEGDRIFILKPEDLPFTWRNQLAWQKEQEDNLLYVALTRSKFELFVVGEPDWLPQEKAEENSNSDTAIASKTSLEQEFSLELKKQEYEEDVEDYSGSMPELVPEDDDEPTETEIYALKERVAEEDLLAELCDTLTNLRSDLQPAETVNYLQSEAEALETLETSQKPALDTKKAITYPFKRWIEPWRISLDQGTQSRKQTNQRTIDNYAEQMREELWDWEREPLPVIFEDGENWYPGDGHHRLMAAIAALQPRIFIEVRSGSLRDAQFFSCGANRFHGLPRTNADKRNQVELLLQDPEWQQMSDRAIAEHCGVSAPFVGKVRAELEAAGTVNVSSERVDRKGRKIVTTNIGTKPRTGAGGNLPPLKSVKQSQAEPEEQQPSGTQASGATVSLSTSPESITQLPPIAQEPTPIKAENLTSGSSYPLKLTQAKLRIEGETREDIDALVQRLRQVFDVIEESHDYPNRGGSGIRRYLTVRV